MTLEPGHIVEYEAGSNEIQAVYAKRYPQESPSSQQPRYHHPCSKLKHPNVNRITVDSEPYESSNSNIGRGRYYRPECQKQHEQMDLREIVRTKYRIMRNKVSDFN